jgi:hypothetical protein
MSRTDKDMPYWAAAEWWKPEHWNCEHDTNRRFGVRRPRRACDLPAQPVVRRDRSRFSGYRRDPRCMWVPDIWIHPFSHVPGWYVQHVWTNAQRRAVRDACRRAAAEYRAGGEPHTEPSVRQARHGARWSWE